MKKYNYLAEITNDIRDYIVSHNTIEKHNRDKLEDQLYDELFVNACVTGNASGSYFCNSYEAEEALCHNLDLLGEALEAFGCGADYLYTRGVEACDVAIRCYLLPQAISQVLDELEGGKDGRA